MSFHCIDNSFIFFFGLPFSFRFHLSLIQSTHGAIDRPDQECPEGVVVEECFKDIYAKVFDTSLNEKTDKFCFVFHFKLIFCYFSLFSMQSSSHMAVSFYLLEYQSHSHHNLLLHSTLLHNAIEIFSAPMLSSCKNAAVITAAFVAVVRWG